MNAKAKLGQTIEAIAAATADEAPWSDVSASLKSLLGAECGALWVGDPSQGRVEILHSSFGADIERDYNAHYHKVDLWAHRGQARNDGNPFLGSELVPDAEFREAEIYVDLFRERGAFHLLASAIPLGGAAGMMAVALHRPEGAPGFTERDRRNLAQVLPYLRRGAKLRHELSQASAAARLAVDGLAAMGAPAILLDPACRILFANAPANVLLKEGRWLLARGGRCVAIHATDDAALAAAVRLVAHHAFRTALRLAVGNTRTPLQVIISGQGGDGVAMIFPLDPASRRKQRDPGLLQDLYGITRAEAEVAVASAQGIPANLIANARGTTEVTVRAQIRSILTKTGAENLRVLAAMIAALPTLSPGS